MSVTIEQERADLPDAMALIQELEDVLNPLYSPDQRFGYSVDKLLQQGGLFLCHSRGWCGGGLWRGANL